MREIFGRVGLFGKISERTGFFWKIVRMRGFWIMNFNGILGGAIGEERIIG